MASLDFDRLGDVQKNFEQAEAGRWIMPGIPVLARLDGRAFHTFTNGLQRPFSHGLGVAFEETTKALLEDFKPDLAYTQSDEITLCWMNPDIDLVKIMFSGKFQKLCSLLAAKASVKFNKVIASHIPSKADDEPTMDCRVWQVPNLEVAAENFLWREMDAVKNSVSMAASSRFPHRSLSGVTTKERLKMLDEIGFDWNALPRQFKSGIFFKKIKEERFLTEEELSVIKPEFRPVGPIKRSTIVSPDWPRLTSITNLVDVLFKHAKPIIENYSQPIRNKPGEV